MFSLPRPVRNSWLRYGCFSIIVVVFILSITGCSSQQLQTLATLKKVDSFPLYVMHYQGDYAFEEFLKKGGENDRAILNYIRHKLSADFSLSRLAVACTMFSARNLRKEALTGRNFDFDPTPTLLLYTTPSKGYASVSMVDLSYLGISRDVLPTEYPKFMGTPYLPFDGMNDQGVCMGMLAVPTAKPGKDPTKPSLNTTAAIRLVLDHAKNVNEAVNLLKKYNIYFSAGVDCHYFISDASGKSVVVEFIDGNMSVVPKTRSWQVVTNFTLAAPDKQKDGLGRYHLAQKILRNHQGLVSEKDAMGILEQVHLPTTLWSVVYNQKTGDFSLVMGQKYHWVKRFHLEIK